LSLNTIKMDKLRPNSNEVCVNFFRNVDF
jgi:hypothetical protein